MPLKMLLPENEVHVWCADPAQLKAKAHARALLDDSERERLDRFHFDRDRSSYLAGHALMRTVLSLYEPVAPDAWRFSAGPQGKPALVQPPARLRFNLTRTATLVACAVSRELELGVDLEDLSRGAPLEIADRHFAPVEVTALKALPAVEQPRRFFEYWTLKESYLKARGLGLALPLDRFWFHLPSPRLEPERPPRLEIDPALGEPPASSWQLVQHQPTATHLLALCIERRDSTDAVIVFRDLDL